MPECENCGQHCATRQALSQHVKACKSNKNVVKRIERYWWTSDWLNMFVDFLTGNWTFERFFKRLFIIVTLITLVEYVFAFEVSSIVLLADLGILAIWEKNWKRSGNILSL